MNKYLFKIALIFVLVTVAWLLLGNVILSRTNHHDRVLKDQVGQLWGSAQMQSAPLAYYETKEVVNTKEGPVFNTVKTFVTVNKSDIDVKLNVDYRKKGLQWYSVYNVDFHGKYNIINNNDIGKKLFVSFKFPDPKGIYDDFKFTVGENEIKEINVESGQIIVPIELKSKENQDISISYKSQGMDKWWYDFGNNVNQVKNFSLNMKTDFKNIDFPQDCISPTEKIETANGWKLKWNYNNLLAGVKIGLDMPKKLNPGPWVANITFFGPISLFLFLFMTIVLSVIKKVKIHPVNYFFICAAYFSFHLLLAYLVDHISIHIAFIISSVVSIFLVVSYMRIVVGKRFAYKEIGISQFIYLVVFSYTFFFKGFTGLTVTILSIITLFISMQITAKIDWEDVIVSKK